MKIKQYCFSVLPKHLGYVTMHRTKKILDVKKKKKNHYNLKISKKDFLKIKCTPFPIHILHKLTMLQLYLEFLQLGHKYLWQMHAAICFICNTCNMFYLYNLNNVDERDLLCCEYKNILHYG